MGKKGMTERQMTERQRKDILLVAIYFFFQHGRKEEVSQAELVDCITEFQKEFPLGYEFSKKLPYFCYQLSTDLNDLWLQEGFFRCHYPRYGKYLMSRNFVALWPLGKAQAKRVVETLEPATIEALRKAVRVAVEKYH